MDARKGSMSLTYSFLNIFQKGILSERAAWAVQNAVGAVFPILFVVVNKLRFSGSCTAILFYGVSSQAFSVDRSIGGRVFGAILWTGGYLFGGLLAYLLTTLAWLARGDAEGILTYEYTGGTLTESQTSEVKSFLSDGSYTDLTDVRSSPGLLQSLEEFNNNTVSDAYYILLIVLHIVCSIYMTRCRTMESDFMSMARGTVSHIFLSVISTLSVLLPLLGQQKYWADAISANLKGVTITMFGAIAGPLLVYVQSSHDNLRRDIGEVMINAGKFLTAKASALHHCLADKDMDISAAQGIAGKMSGISSIQELIKQTLKAEGDAMLCSLEPAWPFFVSQVGMDFRLYQQVLLSLQRLLGTINAMTSISIENLDGLTEKDVRIANVGLECAVGVSTALQDVAVCFQHMPLWGRCSGNTLRWRPKGSTYWNTYLELVQDTLHESLPYLRDSACRGIAASFDANSRHELGLAQLQITQLASSEILIEECIVLEHLAAKALEITDIAYQDMIATPDSLVEHEQKAGSFPRRCVGAVYRAWESLCQNVYVFALSNDLKQGTSYYTYKLQISRFVSTNMALLKGTWLDVKTLKALFHRRDFQFYLKFLIAINSGFVAIILILWLGYGNTDSSIKNATSMANWFGDWKPEYFLTASVICLQMQVEISVVKAILRTSLIAIGGVLGYVTLLNGTLAQNPYFILFMGVLMNGFFGLFSIYGMDFRYSLFLTVYTWNGIVMCHYTGICCSSGTVLDFGGKAVSTCLGAVWALIFSILIKPLYTSEVVFSLEQKFLVGVMGHIEKSFHKGGALLPFLDEELKIQDDDSSSGGIFEKKIIRAQQHPERLDELRAAVNSITQLRISTYKAYGQQITTNSLDKREVVFIKLNLIPLPASIHLIMSHLSPIGAWTSGSLKMLYNYTLGQRGGAVSKYFLQNILEPTDSIIVASKDLVQSISRFLDRRSNANVEEIRKDIQEHVATLQSSRKRLQQAFVDSIQPEVLRIKECSTGDIKCLTWYLLLMSTMTELELMGSKIAKDDSYLERDDYLSFFVSWYTRR